MCTIQRAILFAMLAGVLAEAGCNVERDQVVASGARPPVDIPVGPPPGPDPNLAIVSNPYADSKVARSEGRKLFVWFNCAGCHGDHAGGGMGPSLRDQDWIYGSSEASIFSSIAEGRAHGMPSWGTKLPNDQIWELVTYIKSLRTPGEPDPPPPNPTWAGTPLDKNAGGTR